MYKNNHQIDFKLMAAPLQGFTEAPFRHFHAMIYGSEKTISYYSPFMRVEKGETRRRDLRDISSPLNTNHMLVPQVIAAQANEFRVLVNSVLKAGYSSVDLNAGCPFSPQVHRGRGAGLLGAERALEEIADAMGQYPGVNFSLKMRLGVSEQNEWMTLAPVINRMPLTHVTLHPRTAIQQYSGELQLDHVGEFVNEVQHPVIFNGELHTPADIENVRRRFPLIAGVMAGRGLLMRPSLFVEYLTGCEWDEAKQRIHVLKLHNAILNHLATTLCGDHQVLSKIKPMWEYFAAPFPRKSVKPVLKSRTLSAYLSAVAQMS